jgi:hypothetical protein
MTKFVHFNHCATVETLKAEYRRLVLIHHPDRGGDEATMKAINAEYTVRLQWIQAHPWSEETEAQDAKHDIDDGYREVINQIVGIDGLNVEICGTWVWVTGETKPAKEVLKAAGFKWAGKKVAWYWHSGEYHKRSKRLYTMEEIRDLHGSQRIFGQHTPRLA